MKALYLAGPDVFLPNAGEIGARKREICRSHGFEGIFPLDAGSETDPSAIFRANCARMRRADGGLVNLSPFRGPSADPGTLFELGFLFALGKPVFGYTSRGADYARRVRAQCGRLVRREGRLWDPSGRLVEDYGLSDNLMIPGALGEAGGELVVVEERGRDALAALRSFALLVARLAERELARAASR